MSNDDPLISRPVVGGDSPPTAGEVASMHTAAGSLAKQVGTFNDRLRWLRKLVTIMAVVVVALVGAGGWLLYLNWHINSVVACQAKQNDAFRNASLQSRAAAKIQNDRGIQKIDQEQTMLATVTNPTATNAERAAAIQTYRAAAQASRDAQVAANQTRQDNPLPAGNCS